MMAESASFYEGWRLNVEVYDEFTERQGMSCAGDVDFYAELAREAGGPVLELASGTGRVSFALGEAGFDVVGLEVSEPMLRRAEEKRAAAAAELHGRVRFVRGDMTDFDLETRFSLILIPFRAFQSLLTPGAQKSCLECARRHLADDGRLVVDLFDPQLDRLQPGLSQERQSFEPFPHPVSGNLVHVEVTDHRNDCVRQVFDQRWRYTERDESGAVVRTEDVVLELRWIYRHEMRYLLELCGYEVEAEYSDFRRSPPAYGREQLWVARRA